MLQVGATGIEKGGGGGGDDVGVTAGFDRYGTY
jgi:hypothetical protein